MKWNESASLSQTRTRSVNDLLELTANYNFTIKDSHDFAFLL